MNRLEFIRLKLAKAEEHLDYFKDLASGRKGPVYPFHGVDLHFEPNNQHVTVRSTAIDSKHQVELGIVVGEVIHQARTALDHVVFAIAVARRFPAQLANDEIRNLSFPICNTADSFTADWRISRQFLGQLLGPDAMAEIQNSQPFMTDRGDLWVLKCLDDIDKHRTVLVVEHRVLVELTAYSVDSAIQHNFTVTTIGGSARDQKHPIGWSHSVPPAGVSMWKAHREFIFMEPFCYRRNVVNLLREMIGETRDTIAKFERFLSS